MTANDETKAVPDGLTVIIEFTATGGFSATMESTGPDGQPRKKVERGTYQISGTQLVTNAKKREVMAFNITGPTLTLTKADRAESMMLKRVE